MSKFVDVNPKQLSFSVVRKKGSPGVDSSDEEVQSGGASDGHRVAAILPLRAPHSSSSSRTLTVLNRRRQDAIVYSLRTNQPSLLVVAPRQGILGPGKTATITLTLRRCRAIPSKAAPSSCAKEHDASAEALVAQCRVLVQHAVYTGVCPDTADVDFTDDFADAPPIATEEVRPEDGGPFCQTLHDAAVRLGKDWRGRNFDLYDSGSFIVPCQFIAVGPDNVESEGEETKASINAPGDRAKLALRRHLAELQPQLEAQRRRLGALRQQVCEAEVEAAAARRRGEEDGLRRGEEDGRGENRLRYAAASCLSDLRRHLSWQIALAIAMVVWNAALVGMHL